MKTTALRAGVRTDLIRVVVGTGLVLLVPLVAMRFTGEVVWTLSDFVVAGLIVFTTGMAYTLATRNARQIKRRLAVGAVLLAVFAYVWVELAVGIFTNLGS